MGRWKPAIFIDAAMHAREWIAPSTAVYIIDHVSTWRINEVLFHIHRSINQIHYSEQQNTHSSFSTLTCTVNDFTELSKLYKKNDA